MRHCSSSRPQRLPSQQFPTRWQYTRCNRPPTPGRIRHHPMTAPAARVAPRAPAEALLGAHLPKHDCDAQLLATCSLATSAHSSPAVLISTPLLTARSPLRAYLRDTASPIHGHLPVCLDCLSALPAVRRHFTHPDRLPPPAFTHTVPALHLDGRNTRLIELLGFSAMPFDSIFAVTPLCDAAPPAAASPRPCSRPTADAITYRFSRTALTLTPNRHSAPAWRTRSCPPAASRRGTHCNGACAAGCPSRRAAPSRM
jgi:hypothetical protein